MTKRNALVVKVGLVCIQCLVLAATAHADWTYLDSDLSCENLSIGECAEALHVAIAKKGMFGLGLRCGAQEVADSPGRMTFTVGIVIPGGAAEAAGLKGGDKVVAINGIRVSSENIDELHTIDDVVDSGQQIRYTLLQAGSEEEMVLTAGPVSEEVVNYRVRQELNDLYGREEVRRFLDRAALKK